MKGTHNQDQEAEYQGTVERTSVKIPNWKELTTDLPSPSNGVMLKELR